MKFPAFLLCSLLAIGPAFRAHALAGDLPQPNLAFPSGFPDVATTNILAALRLPECEYLGGNFINWSTRLRYSGNTTALNHFLAGLARCPGAGLVVRFDRSHQTDGCDWLVTHQADPDCRITVLVNLASPRLNLTELEIPETRGPALPAAKTEPKPSP